METQNKAKCFFPYILILFLAKKRRRRKKLDYSQQNRVTQCSPNFPSQERSTPLYSLPCVMFVVFLVFFLHYQKSTKKIIILGFFMCTQQDNIFFGDKLIQLQCRLQWQFGCVNVKPFLFSYFVFLPQYFLPCPCSPFCTKNGKIYTCFSFTTQATRRNNGEITLKREEDTLGRGNRK